MRDPKDTVYMTEQGEYHLQFRFEMKKGNLSALENAVVRACRWALYGEKKCFFCLKPIKSTELHAGGLDIHHTVRKGNEGCNLLPVLRIAHHACNARAGRPKGIPRVRENPQQNDPALHLMSVVPFESGSIEMFAKSEGYPEFNNYLWAMARSKGHELKTEVLRGGAWNSGLSVKTIRTYLEAHLANDAPFMEEGKGSRKVIKLKPEWSAKLKTQMEKERQE